MMNLVRLWKFLWLFRASDMDPEKIDQFFSYYQARYFIIDKKFIESDHPSVVRLKNYLIENLRLKEYYEDGEVIAFKKF